MTYSNQPYDASAEQRVQTSIVDFGDRVHWGPIIAGLVIAISSQLLLSALGIALGFSSIAGSNAPRTNEGGVAEVVGIWSIISLFISLFIGGWVTARACGSINRNTAALNGAILWATTMAISAWLLASGVSGTFGLAVANAGDIANQAEQNGITLPDVNTNTSPNTTRAPSPLPTLSAHQTKEVAGNGAKTSWAFTFGSLLGLAASTIGSRVGAHNARIQKLSSNRV